MDRQPRACVAAVVICIASLGCRGITEQLDQHRQKFESFVSTTQSIGDAWVAGRVSSAYARTALERTLQLVEQERVGLARKPRALADARGAAMSQSAERLSRAIAQLAVDVDRGDRNDARTHLAALPLVPGDAR